VLHAQDHAENIRVERRGIGFRGLVRDGANPAVGASIVDRDIETAKLCDGPVDQSADLILVADVGVDELKERRSSASALPASSRRPATTTFAPFLANATAVARPMPVSAPVIRITGLSIFNSSNMTPI
jgi:hypothetical protein